MASDFCVQHENESEMKQTILQAYLFGPMHVHFPHFYGEKSPVSIVFFHARDFFTIDNFW